MDVIYEWSQSFAWKIIVLYNLMNELNCQWTFLCGLLWQTFVRFFINISILKNASLIVFRTIAVLFNTIILDFISPFAVSNQILYLCITIINIICQNYSTMSRKIKKTKWKRIIESFKALMIKVIWQMLVIKESFDISQFCLQLKVNSLFSAH